MSWPCIEQLAASTDTDEDIVYDQLVSSIATHFENIL